jgi:hypothetical protein
MLPAQMNLIAMMIVLTKIVAMMPTNLMKMILIRRTTLPPLATDSHAPRGNETRVSDAGSLSARQQWAV